jgi:hypothetical protein
MARAVYKCSHQDPEAAYGRVVLGRLAAYSSRSVSIRIDGILKYMVS